MKKFYPLIFSLMVVITVSGCETIKGLGQDIQNTGDNVWEAVTDND